VSHGQLVEAVWLLVFIAHTSLLKDHLQKADGSKCKVAKGAEAAFDVRRAK
jgi:hypothetical protein